MSGDRYKINNQQDLHFVRFIVDRDFKVGWSSRSRYGFAQTMTRKEYIYELAVI